MEVTTGVTLNLKLSNTLSDATSKISEINESGTSTQRKSDFFQISSVSTVGAKPSESHLPSAREGNSSRPVFTIKKKSIQTDRSKVGSVLRLPHSKSTVTLKPLAKNGRQTVINLTTLDSRIELKPKKVVPKRGTTPVSKSESRPLSRAGSSRKMRRSSQAFNKRKVSYRFTGLPV